MTAGEVLCRLQLEQQKHDKDYHSDVFYLPSPQRIGHLVFHFSKYAGRLVDRAESSSQVDGRTLVDTFLVALSAANLLNLDLASLVAPHDETESLEQLGCLLAAETPESSADPEWFLRCLVREGGRMAKACEALDHLEAFDSRGAFEVSTLAIVRGCLVAAALAGLDLVVVTRERWQEIERRSLRWSAVQRLEQAPGAHDRLLD
jgi:hypothetical protein